MGKELTLTDEALQTMLNMAVDKAYSRLDDESIDIAGCDVKCILIYEKNIRNNEKGISLKHYCMQNDMNHRVVYAILRDYGWVEYEGDDKKDRSYLTVEGFRDINGMDEQSSPVITSNSGKIYVDDKDPRFEEFISKVKKHTLYDDSNNGYNSKLKSSNILYSRRELAIANKLGVNILKTKELPNGKIKDD